MQNNKRIIVPLTPQETNKLLHQLCQTREYQNINPQLAAQWKQRFLDYCQGKKTLPLTYDPFYKKIFHPDIHPDRLSRFISAILNRQVRVVGILSEGDSLDGGALLIMDILVELDDGSLANVEIQKIPYLFPAERMSCYSADVLLRQYSRVKGEKGKKFKYSDIKKVYTIVLFEKSTAPFHQIGNYYLHHGRTTFDTGLPLELLQEFYLISLDIFQKSPYAKNINDLNGWLTLLTTEKVEQVEAVIRQYPWLTDIYQEMNDYLHKPTEVLGMYSEALRILDRNTTEYMIEELQREVEQTRKAAAARIKQAQREAQRQTEAAENRAVQAEADAAKAKANAAKAKANAAKAEANAARAEANAAQALIEILQESGATPDAAARQLAKKLSLSQEQAQAYIRSFWNTEASEDTQL